MIAHHLRYLWYLVAGASTIPALRLGRAWWDDDYRRGGLARTEGEIELPRHLLIAGLARHYAPGGRVLDVGCGSGGLTVPLRECFVGRRLRYVGVDCSTIALQHAAAREAADRRQGEPATVQFVQADFDTYDAEDAFDAIIFSESLYYAPNPLRTVRRYARSLRSGGVFIVSMWRRPSRRRVWRALGDILTERTRSRIVVPRRPSWDIVLYTES